MASRTHFHWKAEDIPPQKGRRYLITGGNSGIGYHAALKLARKGAHVVLACRDRSKGETAVAQLREEAPGCHIELALLDLASLASVRSFAEQQLASGLPLHVLINNAGVMAPPKRQLTADGFELQFGTNVLGHFALTALLLPALERATTASTSEPPRVVTIASIAHKRGRINFDDLQSVRAYSPMAAYQQSKLADLIFAFELQRRLSAARSPILSVAAHPGVASTNLFHNAGHGSFERAIRSVGSHAIGILLNTDSEGALPTLFAATSPQAVGGGYYGPTGFLEMRGENVGEAVVALQALDHATAQKLWAVCEQLTGISLL